MSNHLPPSADSYDSHFLVRAISKCDDVVHTIDSIPVNTQKFKMITLNSRIKFIDSFAFLPASLANLVDTARKSDCPFPVLTQMVDGDEESKRLLLRKGVYPYSLATSIDALDAIREFPPIESFFSDLTETECSESDHAFAAEVWQRFGCKNMLDYTTLYMHTDVYLLADVMHQFREQIYSSFELDLCNYLSLPHLSMDIMLKYTGAEIELMSNREMAGIIKDNIRGGHAYAGLRHCLAEPDGGVTMTYLDVNNLYGDAMMQSLPIGDYRWLESEEVASYDPLKDASDSADYGYILEVDLRYPSELHWKHNAFPLAPHNLDITDADLSPYSKACKTAVGARGARHKARKLTATFRDRINYLVHGRNLKYYLEQGLELLKIHRILTFRQAPFIKPFIEMCSLKRMAAKTVAEADLYKLLANSIYGKFIESIDKRMDARFNRSEDRATRNATSPLYKGTMVCDEELTISFHKKPVTVVRQCWAVGFSILELSKLRMAQLYYSDIQPALGVGNVSVVMSDTDSFLLSVKGHTQDQIMDKLAHIMDFSNFDPKHRLYSPERKRVPGYLKNEMPKTSILEAVALKAKSYALKTEEGVKATAKGVVGAVKSRLSFDAFRECYERMTAIRVTQHTINSRKHINRMLRSTKVAFR